MYKFTTRLQLISFYNSTQLFTSKCYW